MQIPRPFEKEEYFFSPFANLLLFPRTFFICAKALVEHVSSSSSLLPAANLRRFFFPPPSTPFFSFFFFYLSTLCLRFFFVDPGTFPHLKPPRRVRERGKSFSLPTGNANTPVGGWSLSKKGRWEGDTSKCPTPYPSFLSLHFFSVKKEGEILHTQSSTISKESVSKRRLDYRAMMMNARFILIAQPPFPKNNYPPQESKT